VASRVLSPFREFVAKVKRAKEAEAPVQQQVVAEKVKKKKTRGKRGKNWEKSSTLN